MGGSNQRERALVAGAIYCGDKPTLPAVDTLINLLNKRRAKAAARMVTGVGRVARTAIGSASTGSAARRVDRKNQLPTGGRSSEDRSTILGSARLRAMIHTLKGEDISW